MQRNQTDIIYDNKFIEVQDIFCKLFRTKGFLSDDFFNKNVWFLKDDLNFQNIIKNTLNIDSTPIGFYNTEINNIHSILRELSEGKDLRKMNIQTRKFIERVSEVIIASNLQIQRAQNQIILYNAHQNKNILEETINLLNTRILNNQRTFFKIKLGRIDLFPIGDYNFTINYNQLNTYNTTLIDFKEVKLKENKLLSVKQDKDIIILKNVDSMNVFNNIEAFSLNVTEDDQIYKSLSFSGCNLSNFHLVVQKDLKDFAYSKEENFLDIFLSCIEELKDISKDSFETTWKVKLYPYNNPNNNNSSNEEYLVYMDIRFEIDPLTRASILKRLKSIFTDVISSKAENECIINEILDKYFPEISESVKFCLNKNEIDKTDNCGACNSCYLI